MTVDLGLRADLNSEDDDGLNWALLRDALDPDGQVHFRQVTRAQVAAR